MSTLAEVNYVLAENPETVEFDYTNHRGEPHHYVVAPECTQWTSGGWFLDGQVVTRDGDPRKDMGPTRRRSFEVDGITNLRPVGGQQ